MVEKPNTLTAIIGVMVLPAADPEESSWTVQVGDESVFLDDSTERTALYVRNLGPSAIELQWGDTDTVIAVLPPLSPRYSVEELGTISACAVRST